MGLVPHQGQRWDREDRLEGACLSGDYEASEKVYLILYLSSSSCKSSTAFCLNHDRQGPLRHRSVRAADVRIRLSDAIRDAAINENWQSLYLPWLLMLESRIGCT